ncbi:MAG: tetratricopeptide repeat protein [Sulfuricellaceae bacterium]
MGESMSVAENREANAASATIAQALRQAVVHHQAGQFQEAEQLYRVILQVQPGHPDANHNLGVLLGQTGRRVAGLPHLKAALEANPFQGDYWLSYADALLMCNQAEDALTVIQTAMQHGLDTPATRLMRDKAEADVRRCSRATSTPEIPDKIGQPQAQPPESLSQIERNQLIALFNAGRHAEMESQARVACERDQDSGFAWKALGVALQMQGKDALAALRRATELLPDDADAHNSLGVVLKDHGQLDGAVASCRRALKIKPDLAEAHSNLGNALRALGQFADAVASYRRALEIKPDYVEAHNNLGVTLKEIGRLDDALASCRRALKIKPDYAEAHNSQGSVLKDLGQLDDAMASYLHALKIKPDFAEVHNNLGNLLKDFGQLDDAVASYRRALEIKPDYAEAYNNLLFTLNYHPDKSDEEIYAAYREYDERFGLPQRGKWRTHDNSREAGRCLKVGYVSPDFRRHSCRHFLEPLLAHHDKKAFDIYAYAELVQEDEVTARYRGYADHWTPTAGMTDEHLSERIRADGIDILVDMAGHTKGNRLSVFAQKPAPVSLSWLGFGYTTGLSAVDYLLTDATSAPEGSEGLFSEVPWRLETPVYAYRPAEGMGLVSPLPALTRGHITFGTLTRAVRINHRTIRVWSEILKQVAGARLVIDSRDFRGATMQAALAEKFAAHGVARDRLEIGYHSPPWDILRGLDIGLDCFPHNSGTTLFETLYMGVPFITLAERPSVGRLGSSILEGIGHSSLIAHTEDEYVEIAVALATDLPKLATLRGELRQEMESGPLMDEAGFARKVETAYREMWSRWSKQSGGNTEELPERTPQPQTKSHGISLAELLRAGKTVAGKPAKKGKSSAKPASSRESLPQSECNQLVALFNGGRYTEMENRARLLIERYPDSGFAWKGLGASLQMQGKNALAALQKAAERLPNDADAHNNLGNALRNLGRIDEAAKRYAHALKINPDFAEAHNNLGNALHDLGRFEAAAASCRHALQIKPDFAEAHSNLGNALLALGRLEGALASYAQALALKPDYAEAHNNLGVALQALGRFEDAVASHTQALEIKPDYAEAHNNLGNALKDLERLDDAVASFRRALEIKPDYAEAHNNLGNALRELGQRDGALASYTRALEIAPGFAEAHNNLGNVLKDFERLDDAVASYAQALEIKPDYFEAYNNLGNALKDLGQLDKAVASYAQALKIKPDFAEAHSNLGSALKDLGRFGDAEASFRHALEIKPDYAEAYNNLLFTLNYHPDKSGEEIFAAYREYDERFGLPLREKWQPHGDNRDPQRRLKVGYVSPDFRRHSCRHFLEPLLAQHDKNAVEVYAYAELTREDNVTARYKGYVDHWTPTVGMSDERLSARIRADGIDILVDLAGHTANNRLSVFARKPAPVSLSWLGFGYTTGLTAVDYLLTDAVAAPEGSEGLFSETPWRLETPGYAYRPAEGMGAVNTLPALTRGHVTFGALTRAVRINPLTIRVWSALLKRVEGARLVIDSRDFQSAAMQDALAAKFAAQGIVRERLAIGFHSPPWDVLRSLDIGLDCFPHNSGTTLFETLYMGVPFITLAGRPSVGRLGSSILEGIGHPSLIAHTEDEYVEIAAALASDLPKLATLRGGLRQEMEIGALMDETGFARKVEAAYREMWGKWCCAS